VNIPVTSSANAGPSGDDQREYGEPGDREGA
jgi:hypothetical protein